MILLALPCWATDWVADVDRDLQWAFLEDLTGRTPVNGTSIASRNIHHEHHALARAYLWARLRRIPGLRTREEPFRAEGEDGLANLVAVVPGSNPTLDPIVVSAHYDSTASLGDTWSPTGSTAPGADDDASGCAAILELARLLSTGPGHERDIELVLFDAEEEGLLGSEDHVAHRTRGVHVMLSLDPVGYNAGGAGWLFASAGPDTDFAVQALEASMALLPLETVQRFDAVDAALIGPARSDHGPFLEAGYPALHIGTFPQPPTYHTPGDTLDVVDPGFVADTTSLVGAAVSELAGPLEPDTRRACAHTRLSGLWAWALVLISLSCRGTCRLRRGT
ncbi:MAG: M28 family metallopeptidase [Myxococcota bacterium]